MPEAPCNDLCRGDCRPGPGCAFNLLCVCCNECIEPPAESAAAMTETTTADGDAAAKVYRAQMALLRFIITDPLAESTRKALRKAIEAKKQRDGG